METVKVSKGRNFLRKGEKMKGLFVRSEEHTSELQSP